MFGKKYVFETKSTQFKRALVKALVLTCVFCIFIISVFLYLPFYAYRQAELADTVLYAKSPDLIAVFTGDHGRIDYAFKLAQHFKTSKIFISGVYNANSIQSLIQHNRLQIADSSMIELDYNAKNTPENVISLLHFLRKRKEFNNILIVSSEYHILRINLILNSIRAKSDHYNFYYKSQRLNYLESRNFRPLFKEFLKLFKAIGFILLWDADSPLPLDIEMELNAQ